MARRRCNRAFRVAAGMLGATALAVTALTPAPSRAVTSVAAHSSAAASLSAASLSAASLSAPSLGAPSLVARTRAVGGRPVKSASCSRTLNVVAHEDDDLLFINPSVSADIAAGRCVVTVFVTAGDSGRPPSYWLRRERGSMAAYAAMSGTSASWESDTLVLAGHPIVRQRLRGTRITLLFMRLPDAHGSPLRPFGTLPALWQGEIPRLRPLGSGGAYTRQTLVKTLTAAMAVYQPDRIRTLDYAGHYGDGDHADHHTVGYFTFAAQRSYHAHHRISGYRGYTVAAYPDNLDESAAGRKLDYFLAYAPYDSKVCQSADACLTNFYGPRFTHSLTTASSVH
ncbi:PIG-L family deacetylase [Actinoplanes sp. NPDC051411]|uniref:PIG-L family deacetylase n=1 Tax=Actinoplanes sp. NPDC051411 TaxID=3155522 RepID=UPI0034457F14